jgi:hypothetical protein
MMCLLAVLGALLVLSGCAPLAAPSVMSAPVGRQNLSRFQATRS